MPRAKPTFLCWVVALILAAPTPRGQAQAQATGEPPLPSRYQVTQWKDTEGLPQNSVYSLARTPDGYLWFGTAEGLVRFDGVRFTVFDVGNTPALGNSRVESVLADRTGTLWIGTAGGGLTGYYDGVFTAYTARDGFSGDYVTCLCEDRAGTVWAGTLTHGLNRWKDGRWSPAVPALADRDISALAADPSGDLWAGMPNGLFRVHGDTATAYPPPEGTSDRRVRSLCCDHAGRLWVGTSLGLQRLDDGRLVTVDLAEGEHTNFVQAICEARDGTLWIGHGNEVLCRGADGRFVPCRTQGALASTLVWALGADPEGNVWVGTDATGLFRLRHGAFGAYTTLDGLSTNFLRAVCQDAAGTMWVATTGGLDRWQDGRFVPVGESVGLSIPAVATDLQGTLWAATGDLNRRICRVDGDRLVPLLTIDKLTSIHALLADRLGGLWIGTSEGLFHRSSIDTSLPAAGTRKVLDGYIEGMFEDRAGAVWIGTMDGGLSRYRDGRVTTWTTADGLSSNHVMSFYEDAAGTLWIGTHGGGLCRFKDGRFSTVTTRDGLYDGVAFSILEDAAGNFWMSGNKGVYRARRRDLEACMDGRTHHVDSVAYGAADGMLSRECSGGSPAAWKKGDGTLWFTTIGGVAAVDPTCRDPPRPRPAIEAATVDHAPRTVSHAVELHPGQTDLEVQYTAFDWQQPERVRFQYQLAGLDRDWQDVGTRRTADFSHLPPGNYAFRVRADGGDGAWSEPASVAVIVLPPFWRTWWFMALVVSLAVALVGSGFRWRGQQLQRRFAVQQDFSRRLIAAHESERRRIAAELHDSLGQTLAMIKNSAVAGTHHAHDPAAAQAQMEQITQQSTHAIGEVREIAYNLRPYLLDRLGLTKALRSMLHKIKDSSGLAITAELDSIDGRFPADAEMSIYRVVQESFNNVLKHADAKHVRVRLQATPITVELTIQDDGRGFDATTSNQEERRGFGLLGIAERVRLLGGTCAFKSKPGAGTTVSIHLPLPTSANTAS